MTPDTGQPDVRFNQRSRNSSPDPAPGLSVGQIFGMLAKHKWYIVASTLLFALAALVYVKLAKPVYEATATIRIDQGRASSLGINDLVSGNLPGGTDVLATEIEVLQTDQVAIAALDSLPDDVFERFAGADKKGLLIPTGKEVLTPDQEDLIGLFKNQLAVKQVPDTQLVNISFQDTDPKLAATIVNHTVAAYLRQNFDSHYGSVAQVTEYLSGQIAALKQRAADAQSKLAAFQEQNGILDTDSSSATSSSNTTTDRLRLLNSRLAEAEADRITKQAQLQAATAGNPDVAVLSSLFSNPELGALQASRGALYSQYAQLASKFGANYAPLAQVKNQLDQVDAEINRNVKSIQNRLNEEYNASKASEDMLRREYAAQTGKAYALNRQGADLAVLQSEVTESREIYNSLQLKLQQAGINAGLSGVNTLPIDIARAPTEPIKPKKLVVLAVGTALGFLIGIASVFIVEASADKVQSLAQIGSSTGYRPLVSIPHREGKSSRGESTLDDPQSSEAEAYRRLRSLLMHSAGGEHLRTLMITSADANEGKGTTATNLAGALAQTGAKVLLVDAELRSPSLHRTFAVENGAGLSEALGEPGREAQVKQPVATLPNLHLVTAGQRAPFPAELLGSDAFKALLQRWKGSYDFVILKSAPLLPVSDGLPLARWADGVVLVARQSVTRLKHLQSARELLDETEANVLGIVLNDATDKGAALRTYGKEAHDS